jgi:threonine synthase
MKYLSTRNSELRYSFGDAVIKGLADDGGLFLPEFIPVLPESFFKNIEKLSFTDIAFEIASKFIDDITPADLRDIIEEAVNFPAPVVPLNGNFSILELFHGNTCAFKDFGARFLAGALSHYLKKREQRCTILVATSGDTGSAVASGFYGKENIDVIILYPSGKVSRIQEQQLTTFGKNIMAYEIDGVFDDCQRLVKTAFLDKELTDNYFLTSANSINIGRLLPQSFYYVNAWKQIKNKEKDVVFVVPSGNLGNLTSGILAKTFGLPVKYFVSALNRNDIFKKYLESGSFTPVPSIPTISNAMDVGNPSNLERISYIFKNDMELLRQNIHAYSYDDEQTKAAINSAHESYGYVFDPHGAVGYLATKEDSEKFGGDAEYIILETAHPAKFLEEVKDSEKFTVEMPERLAEFLKKEKESVKVGNDYADFKKNLLINLKK